MKCIDCRHCQIKREEDLTSRARCLLERPPKKGKIITWAMTIQGGNDFDATFGYVTHGDNRVRESLKRKKKSPKWCPLAK